MSVTAALVKELREKSGAGMMDCKKALAETDGDMEAAIDWLRSQSMAASMSPSVSASAFLQSIMPAPDFSRSSFTSAAVTLIVCIPFQVVRTSNSVS